MTDTKPELGALFYPTKDTFGQDIPFDSLYIPYIYKEIYLEGVYLDVLNQKKDLTIVDVGANIGVTVQYFRPYAKKLYAIEPSPEHFAALKQNKEFNKWDNVEIFNYALAGKDGQMEFSQNSQNRTMNSLIVGKEVGVHKHELQSGIQDLTGTITAKGYDNHVTVQTKSIDHFFEENNIEEVDFMKFDPEGAEDMILRSEGFKKIAHKIKAIEVEFHFPTWQNLVGYLQSLGYQARRYDSSAIIVLFFR
jgi:FkbM family methyltransferase